MMYGVLIPGEDLPRSIVAATARFAPLLRALSAWASAHAPRARRDASIIQKSLAAKPVPGRIESEPYCRLSIVQYWQLPGAGLRSGRGTVRGTAPTPRGARRFWRLSGSAEADRQH